MSDQQPRIAILMPTWNSVRFLQEQVDSLLSQTYQNFVIVTRDDGSSDDSTALMSVYVEAHPEHFHVVVSDGRNLGASGSFACLLDYALANKNALGLQKAYLMFCDHDDIWFPHKIAVTMQKMQDLEALHPGMPALVHSDLHVVDDERRQIALSFFQYQGIQPRRNGFSRILVSNTVTGCTALINEELATLAMPIPADAIMHDWWLALVASAFGKIVYIDEALLDYRQHDANAIGAREYLRSERPNLLVRLFDNRHAEAFKATARQARVFHATYGDKLNASQQAAIGLTRMMSVRFAPLQKMLLKLLQV
ncbi:MAG: glycosyltransferase family 2 protein [Gammaproteobacteria bacterium]|nr:glycosyltransferase family 2 protein [Gammaproteobacteria bacterium]